MLGLLLAISLFLWYNGLCMNWNADNMCAEGGTHWCWFGGKIILINIYLYVYTCVEAGEWEYIIYSHTHNHTDGHNDKYASKVNFWFWGICYLTELSKNSFKIIKCVGILFCFVTRKHNSCYSLLFWWPSYGGFRGAYFMYICVESFLIPHLPSTQCPEIPAPPRCASQESPTSWRPFETWMLLCHPRRGHR